jgi:hypothetical protein
VALTGLLLLVGCSSPTLTSPPAVGPTASPNAPTPTTGAADPTSGPVSGDRLPPDVVGAIDAIVKAASLDDAIAATRVVLERSGVVITDDPSSAPRSVAGIYIDSQQLATMAREARSRAGLTHVTFSEFAETFAALALLPPNDALLDRLPAPGASPAPANGELVSLDLNGQPVLLAEFLTRWVNRSLAAPASDDPQMSAMRMPTLYLAELAARQYDPVDLRKAFVPSRLDLGALDITLLLAAIRTSLVLGAGSTAAAPGAILGAPREGADRQGRFAAVDPTACGDLSRRLNEGVPVLPDVGTFVSGEAIKAFAEATVRDMFKNGGGISKAVAPAFEAAGVLFRVHALWLLYQHTDVTLEIQPATIHKPLGVVAPAAAFLVAGIEDGEWDSEVEDRNSSPLTANLKACARLLGIPVTSDLVDIGEATSTWRASWSIPEGAAHAQFEGCQFIATCQNNVSATGRLERKLSKKNDHQGEDTVIVEIKTEKERDHPGEEQIAPVRVCAHLRTDKPPDVGTLLNAVTSGQTAGFGIGGIASLSSAVANILLSWWQFVFTIDTCAYTAVTYHVPQPGNWHGTITTRSSYYESVTSSTRVQTTTTTRSVEVTDSIHVSGDDKGQDAGLLGITLPGHQFTSGGDVARLVDHVNGSNASGCKYTTDTTDEAAGGWAFDGETEVTIRLTWDGKYSITANGVTPPDEVILPGTWTKTIADNGSIYECEGFGTFTRDSPRSPLYLSATGGLLLEGQLDIANPGQLLEGSMTVRDPNDPRAITTIEWEIRRITPIVLPEFQPG